MSMGKWAVGSESILAFLLSLAQLTPECCTSVLNIVSCTSPTTDNNVKREEWYHENSVHTSVQHTTHTAVTHVRTCTHSHTTQDSRPHSAHLLRDKVLCLHTCALLKAYNGNKALYHITLCMHVVIWCRHLQHRTQWWTVHTGVNWASERGHTKIIMQFKHLHATQTLHV